MARYGGSGLKVVESNALAQAPNVIDVERGAGAAWASVARDGEQFAGEALASLKHDEHRAEVAKLAEIEVSNRTAISEARDRLHHDPAGFKAWAQGHVEGALGNVPPKLVPHVRQFLSRQTDSAYDAILSERRSRDQTNGTKAMVARLTMADNDTMSEAAAGRVSQERFAEYDNILRAGVASGFITEDEARLRAEDLTDRARASAATRQIKGIYEDALAQGLDDPRAVALDAARRLIKENPDLKIKESKRDGYYHKATAEIRALESLRRQDLTETRRAAQDLYTALRTVRVSPEQVDEVAGQLMSLGDRSGAMRLKAAHIRADEARAIVDPRMPLDEATDRVAAATGRFTQASPQVQQAIADAAQRTGVPMPYLVRTAARESSFDPRARADTSTATGLFQFTDRTWSETLATHGSKYGLTAGASRTDPTANALMAGELAKDNKAELEQRLGRPVSWGEVYVAHFAGAEGAVKLLASPPNTSGASVLPKAAVANRAIFYNADGSPRSVAQITANLTRGFERSGPTDAEPGFIADPRLARASQEALQKRVNETWKEIEKGLDKGVLPGPDVYAPFLRAASLAGDHRLIEEIATRVERYEAVKSGRQLPATELEARATELARRGGAEGLDEGEAALHRDLTGMLADHRRGLADNPVAYTVKAFPERYKTPAPIDWSNPDGIAAGLNFRQQVARHAGENYKLGTVSPLDDTEMAGFKAAWDASTPERKVAMLSGMSRGLDGLHLAKLLQKASVGDASLAAAGGLYREAPDVAAGIVRGQAALASDKRYLPTGSEKTTTWPEEMDRRLPVTGFAMGARQDATGAVATIRKAIEYRYADLAARAGDTSAEVKTDRLDQAIKDVTGGVVKMNGQAIVAPRRGMDQGTFDRVIAGVTDADLAGAATLSGKPITADFLRRSARLVAFADGRYLVQTNQDNASPTYAATNVNTELPGLFVLDLRRIKPAAMGDDILSDIDRVRLNTSDY